MKRLEIGSTANLERLRKITEKLTAPPPFPVGGGRFSFPAQEGDVTALPLFSEGDKVATILAIAAKGTVYPDHVHDVHETITIYQGVAEVKTDRGVSIHTPFDNPTIYLSPGEKHALYFPEEAKMICTTVPKAKEWPSDPRERERE